MFDRNLVYKIYLLYNCNKICRDKFGCMGGGGLVIKKIMCVYYK